MAHKESRQSAILRLVRTEHLGTQAELIARLRRDGLDVDQSTLSRDLSELGVRKASGRYVAPVGTTNDESVAVPAPRIEWFTACGPHMIVMRTRIGQAQPVALEIDEQDDAAILATLAGDDTVFITTKSSKTQTVALRRLKQWFGDKYVR